MTFPAGLCTRCHCHENRAPFHGSQGALVSQPWFDGSFSHPPAPKGIRGIPRIPLQRGLLPLCTPLFRPTTRGVTDLQTRRPSHHITRDLGLPLWRGPGGHPQQTTVGRVGGMKSVLMQGLRAARRGVGNRLPCAQPNWSYAQVSSSSVSSQPMQASVIETPYLSFDGSPSSC